MISIVTAYYNRKELFVRTLKSIQQYAGNTEYEIIAVDDGSDEHERLEDLIAIYPRLRVIRLERTNNWFKNSCIPFNTGFKEVKGEKVIFQNPECMHLGPILQYVDKSLNNHDYISFGCFSLGIENTNMLDELPDSDLRNIIGSNHLGYIGDGLDCWYNHSKYRPCGYHFCAAMHTRDIVDLGGFDERFALGVAFDDDEILARIRKKSMKVIIMDDIIVLHQNHYNRPSELNNLSLLNKESEALRKRLVERNKNLYNWVTLPGKDYRVGVLETRNPEANEKLIPRHSILKRILRRLKLVLNK